MSARCLHFGRLGCFGAQKRKGCHRHYGAQLEIGCLMFRGAQCFSGRLLYAGAQASSIARRACPDGSTHAHGLAASLWVSQGTRRAIAEWMA